MRYRLYVSIDSCSVYEISVHAFYECCLIMCTVQVVVSKQLLEDELGLLGEEWNDFKQNFFVG